MIQVLPITMSVEFAYLTVFLTFARASPLHEAVYKSANVRRILSLLPTNDVNEKNEDNLTALHVAVSADDIETCRLLLESGANLEAEDGSDATPLIYSVVANNVPILKLLLRKGAKVHRRTGTARENALHIAARWNYVEIFEALTQREDADVNVVDNEGSTPVMLAAERGHVDILNLHSTIETWINKKDGNGRTALHRAVIAGQMEAVNMLLDFPVRINKKDTTGATAVHHAARLGYKDILCALVYASGDQEVRDNAGNTALLSAVAATSSTDLESHLRFCRRSAEIVRALLLLKSDVKAVDNEGRNAADLALLGKNYVAHSILKKEITLTSSPDGTKSVLSALHCAILDYEKRPDISGIRELLHRDKSCVNKKNHLGKTPLHLAVALTKPEIVRMLIEEGADPICQDAIGNTPLHFAKTAEVALILLKANCDAANISRDGNHLPLHTACEFQRLDVVRVLAPATSNIHAMNDPENTALVIATIHNNVPIVKCLLQHGAGFNIPPKSTTPLHWALRKNLSELARLFINRGLNVKAVDKLGDTAAHFVAGVTGNVELLRNLLAYFEADVTDNFGYTPLHCAAMGKYARRSEVIRLLLAAGSSIDARTSNGRSPLYIASSYGHADAVKLLLNHSADTRLISKGQNALHAAIASASYECAELLINADPCLVAWKDNAGAKPVDLLFNYDFNNPDKGRMMQVRRILHVMSPTVDEIGMSHKKTMWILSLKFSTYVHRLKAPVTFDVYIKRAIDDFTQENKLQDASDVVKAYLDHGMGTFYSLAAAYYPNLASFEAPASVGELRRIQNEYRTAVQSFEIVRQKKFYYDMLRFMMKESCLKYWNRIIARTYMEFLPPDLAKDIWIEIANCLMFPNLLGKIELSANSLMLALDDKNQVRPYRKLLMHKMDRLSRSTILRFFPTIPVSFKRKYIPAEI